VTVSFVSSRGTVTVAQRTVCDRLYKPAAKKPVIFLAGWTGTQDYFADDQSGIHVTGQQQTRDLITSNFAVGSIAEGSTWGNSTQLTNIGTLKTNMQTALSASGKIGLVGISAGAAAAANYAIANPTLVFAMVLILPAVNLQRLYDEDPGGLGISASISTAHAGRPSNGNNPLNNAATLSGIPHKLLYSTNDSMINSTDVTDFCTASGGTAVSMGSVSGATPTGHGIDSATWTAAGVGAYLAANIS
jgi:hypothetical protein